MNKLYIFYKKEYRILFLILLVNILIPKIINGQDFWEEIDFPYGTSIFDITVDNQGQIFIGAGDGVYYTSNFGMDWEYIGLNRIIRDIESENNVVYAGATQSQWTSGLWRTDDSGYTWDSIIPDIGITGNVIDILPIGDTIFTSIWTYNTSLYRTTDNGITWDLVFSNTNSNEFVSDIVISNTGVIYIGLDAYYENMGGVYKSIDLGNSWEFIGLLNYRITSLNFNNDNDLFAGSFGGLSDSTSSGLFVLRNGENNWTSLLIGASVQDIETSYEGHIYFTSYWPSGVFRSLNNGATFEEVNEGLPSGNPVKLTMDNDDFLYTTSHGYIARSINPLVSIISPKTYLTDGTIILYPNPTSRNLHINAPSTLYKAQYEELSVLDLKGEILYSSKKSSLEKTSPVNVSSYTPGVYFVSIIYDNKLVKSKFIKQ